VKLVAPTRSTLGEALATRAAEALATRAAEALATRAGSRRCVRDTCDGLLQDQCALAWDRTAAATRNEGRSRRYSGCPRPALPDLSLCRRPTRRAQPTVQVRGQVMGHPSMKRATNVERLFGSCGKYGADTRI